MMELMPICVYLRDLLCCHDKRLDNRKTSQDAKEFVICVIVPSLAFLHLVKWCSGFNQHSLNRSQFVEVFVFTG